MDRDSNGGGGGAAAGTAPPLRRDRPEVVEIELFASRLEAIAREMGDLLQRTALSTNIKERLDFSCAVLDPGGELVVNAPHIPVHLGALGLCVRALREAIAIEPGDVILTNHPAFGGSHLPDVTLVHPVHTPEGRRIGYVASRAHHAEVGGTRPGSMPPRATTLAEEGVVLPPMHLVRRGEPRFEAVRHLLSAAPYPSRSPDDNLADLAAALAACRQGADALARLAAAHGVEALRRQMERLKARARRLLEEALRGLPEGRTEAEERLDDGAPIRVAVTIANGHVTIDFAGTAHAHPGNLNATPAIVQSAVLYVLRLLVREPLPLNEGLLGAVTLRIPPGSLLSPPFDASDPARCPAVVGGNTETSQRLVDTLVKAFGLAACSQGTMNNVLWGADTFATTRPCAAGQAQRRPRRAPTPSIPT
jgi:5-oxoprolinase (ATP-hydrolysing)